MRRHILALKISSSTEMTPRTIILALVFAAALGTAAHAEPNKDQAGLQESCGKRAEQTYNNENMDKSGDEHFTYLNHYNTTLSKCFYLPSKHIVVWQDLVNATSTVHRDLVDPNENKTYGEFVATWTMVNTQWSPVSVHRCYVQEKTCSSESEWQELIKPYMEG